MSRLRHRVTRTGAKRAGPHKNDAIRFHIVDVARRYVAPFHRIVAIERTDDAKSLLIALSVVAVIARRRAGRFSLQAIPSSAAPQLCPARKPSRHFKSGFDRSCGVGAAIAPANGCLGATNVA